MAKLEDIGSAVIINGSDVIYVELTTEEKQKRLEEMNKAESEAAKEQDKDAKKLASLEKLKANKDYDDLLIVLGLDG